MKKYLVGGAVRDELLGKPVTDRDWVVVDSSVEEMIGKNFTPVGKQFPIFIHPTTGEEYALARTEKKVGRGYHGFTFQTDPSVTLTDDLKRRDLTINAIAKDSQGNFIDPFSGVRDLKNKKLRHVSAAFCEDPVRILRIARFAAKLKGFTVAPETMTLMQKMVENGEVDALVPERICKELTKALQEEHPERFFEVLDECNALAKIFPEIKTLQGIPNPAKWHPEIDSYIHTLLALKMATAISNNIDVRFAVLVHDLGKAKSPKATLTKHHGHEELGVPIVKALCKRLRAPAQTRDLAVLVTKLHGHIGKAFELKPKTILKLLNATDYFRRPEKFENLLLASEADMRGRKGFESLPCEQITYLRQIAKSCAQLDIKSLIKNAEPQKIPLLIHNARLNAIKQIIKTHNI